MAAETATETTAGRRERIGLAVLALPTLLHSLDMSVLSLALPQLSADLGAGAVLFLVMAVLAVSALRDIGVGGDEVQDDSEPGLPVNDRSRRALHDPDPVPALPERV